MCDILGATSEMRTIHMCDILGATYKKIIALIYTHTITHFAHAQ